MSAGIGETVRRCEVNRYLADTFLHPQQRGIVSFVEDAPSRCKQILKALATYEVLGAKARPGEKGLVHSNNGAV